MTRGTKTFLVFIGVMLFVLWVVLGCPMPAHSQAKTAIAAHCAYNFDSSMETPDTLPTCTPGVIDPTIVADLSKKPHLIDGVEHNICASDFRTPPFRVATKSKSIKLAVCAKYGIAAKDCVGSKYELDDSVPVEDGGKNVEANLWPQDIHQARIKDHEAEDTTGGPRGLVCAGKITLKSVQTCFQEGDWVKCAAKVKALEAK